MSGEGGGCVCGGGGEEGREEEWRLKERKKGKKWVCDYGVPEKQQYDGGRERLINDCLIQHYKRNKPLLNVKLNCPWVRESNCKTDPIKCIRFHVICQSDLQQPCEKRRAWNWINLFPASFLWQYLHCLSFNTHFRQLTWIFRKRTSHSVIMVTYPYNITHYCMDLTIAVFKG